MRIFRWIAASCFLLLTVFLTASQMPVSVLPTPAPEEKEEIPYDYDLSLYMTLGDISAIEASFEDPTVCTEKEIDDAVFQILLSAATFTEKTKPAERYNKVLFDFSIEQNGAVLPEYSQSDYEIVIGLESNNAIETVLGEELMGSLPSEVLSVSYTYPETMTESPLAGQSVVLKATVKKVYQHLIPELIDSWVAEAFQGEFSSVQEFRESIRLDILKEKEMAKAKAVWMKILESTYIRSYPQKEVEEYITIYKKSFEDEAKRFEISLEELVTLYMQQNMEQFQEEARLFAQEKVKNEMIFTQLVRLQGIEITKEEYDEALLEYFENEKGEFDSIEEFVLYYGEENLHQSILWDKALKAVVDRAVCVS